MSQIIFSSIDPAISGTTLATTLNDFKAAIVTGMSGTTRPTELDPGGGWIDTTNDPTTWTYRVWTGTDDIAIFTLNLASGTSSIDLAVGDFTVKKVTADTVGALLKLVKNRIATNGQVLSGDTVGEIQFIGRADDSSNPVVAKMVWVASDNQTTSAYGGEFAFYSVADSTATLTKHMRFVDGVVETLVPLKINSLKTTSQNVATTATIVKLSATYETVEMTGSTATDIQGIAADGNTKVITIHNRSSAVVTVKHQNGTAAAADRIKLPLGVDHAIAAESTATFYYCTTDLLWKLKSTGERNYFTGFTTETFYGAVSSWTSPSTTTSVRVRAYKKEPLFEETNMSALMPYGSAYAWGYNANGELGIGDVTKRSSPVLVLGGLSFQKMWSVSTNVSRFALDLVGAAYAWGNNPNGQLGLGNVTPQSSPVAVLGGLKWSTISCTKTMTLGLTTGGVLYAWGKNTRGELGVGDVTPRSSPVAVLGGLKFVKVLQNEGSSETSCYGLTASGSLYAWGYNSSGELGVGDVAPRSSPVAVLGGLTFKDFSIVHHSGFPSVCAITNSGVAYSWGYNGSGELGVGDVTPRSSPVIVLGGLTFAEIYSGAIASSGLKATFGRTTSGATYAWGSNDYGQLGVGDVTKRSSPVLVLGGLTFVKSSIGSDRNFGITSDGTAYSWGRNQVGDCGVGDVVSRSSPVAVLGGLKFVKILVNSGPNTGGILGITATGTQYAWGNNAHGDCGVGDATNRSSPVLVLGGLIADLAASSFSSFLSVVGSTAYPLVINDGGTSYFSGLSLGTNIYKVEIEYST
jgi:alpha-tubulin suppressor-like RCC1 family protein